MVISPATFSTFRLRTGRGMPNRVGPFGDQPCRLGHCPQAQFDQSRALPHGQHHFQGLDCRDLVRQLSRASTPSSCSSSKVPVCAPAATPQVFQRGALILNSAVELSWVERDRRARRWFQGKYGVRSARRLRPTVHPASEAILPLQVVGSVGHRQFCPLSTAANRLIPAFHHAQFTWSPVETGDGQRTDHRFPRPVFPAGREQLVPQCVLTPSAPRRQIHRPKVADTFDAHPAHVQRPPLGQFGCRCRRDRCRTVGQWQLLGAGLAVEQFVELLPTSGDLFVPARPFPQRGDGDLSRPVCGTLGSDQ